MHCDNSEAATFTSQINHMLERGRFGGKACAVSGQNRRCTKNIAATFLGTIHIYYVLAYFWTFSEFQVY